MAFLTRRLFQLYLFMIPLAQSSPAAPIPAPGAKAPSGAVSSPALKVFVTTATTITAASTTSTVNAGAIVAALAGGAALAALPKILPGETVGETEGSDSGEEEEDDDDDDDGCNTMTASICTHECTARLFVSECKLATTSSCSSQTCSTSVGCNARATTTTVNASPSPLDVTVYDVTRDGFITNPTTAPSYNPAIMQAYLGKEYQRLHIDSGETKWTDGAKCEEDPTTASLELKGVQDNIRSFCKDNNGGTASPNKGVLLTYNQDENRMQTVLQVDYAGARGQGATYTIDEKRCNDAFGSILKCNGPDKQHTFGGNITDSKGVYVIKPHMYPGTLTCAPDDSKFGALDTEANGNIDEFCSRFDGQQITRDDQKTQGYFQKTGGLLSEYTIKWAPDSVGCSPDGLHDQPYKINKAACKRFLSQVITDCNKDKPNFKAGGVVVDQCASFSLGNINREHLICSSDPRYTASEKQNLHPFTRDDAIGAIEEFCSKDLLADPEAKDTSGDFSQSGDWPKGIAKGGKKGVAISVTFPSGISSEFYPTDTPKARHLQAGGPDCRRRLADLIVDGCDGNDASKKMGGSLIESGFYGCVQWQLLSKGG